jgi:hypothetical protein
MQRQQNSASGIGVAQQSAAEADLRGAQWGAIGGVATSVFGFAAGQIGTNSSPNINPPTGQNFSPVTARPQTSIFG